MTTRKRRELDDHAVGQKLMHVEVHICGENARALHTELRFDTDERELRHRAVVGLLASLITEHGPSGYDQLTREAMLSVLLGPPPLVFGRDGRGSDARPEGYA